MIFVVWQHILYAHGAYFMNRFGSLDIWSTQGMEKSHYRAKGVYFKNTRHGGGLVRSNYLKEMFDWFYRTTFGRKRVMERARESLLAKEARRAAHRKLAQRWRTSQGPVRHALWRASRIRKGKLWARAA